jgi:hypothetical protein
MSAPESPRRCDLCRHYAQPVDPSPLGECRIAAPVRAAGNSNNDRAFWPKVRPCDWCRRFVPADLGDDL